VARVSRKALIVTGGVLAIGVAAALAWSLRQRERSAAQPVLQPAASPPEAVTGLPRDYLRRREVPMLGPPLPGDLGQPMVSAQRARGLEGPATSFESATPAPARLVTPRPVKSAMVDPAVQGGQAARAAGLFTAAARRAEQALPATSLGAAGPSVADERATSPERLQPPASPYVLQAGSIIPAALVTGLRSDVAGLAVAQVTQDVFDSLGGGVLLIPAGARLLGEYDSALAAGQSRLGVVWTRLILPSGRSILLDKLPAADLQGMAGLQDGVDHHGREVLAAAALSTLLAVGAEAGATGESDLARAVRRGVSDTAGDVGRQMVGSSLARAPTLTIRPGAPLRVLLTRDLVLEPYVEGVRR
jgi:type IV secretion system protein VirB10